MPDAHVQELGGVDPDLFAVLASSCVFVDAVERVTSTEAEAGLHPDIMPHTHQSASSQGNDNA